MVKVRSIVRQIALDEVVEIHAMNQYLQNQAFEDVSDGASTVPSTTAEERQHQGSRAGRTLSFLKVIHDHEGHLSLSCTRIPRDPEYLRCVGTSPLHELLLPKHPVAHLRNKSVFAYLRLPIASLVHASATENVYSVLVSR